MVTLILPGFSKQNKQWSVETAENLKLDGEIRPISWDHWVDATKEFIPEDKARILIDIVGDRFINIIAKSIGAVVAADIILKVPEKIKKVILSGIPLNDMTDNDKEVLGKALKTISPDKILCFQNDEDPHADIHQVRKFLMRSNPNIRIVPKNRADHEYPYYPEFQEFLNS